MSDSNSSKEDTNGGTLKDEHSVSHDQPNKSHDLQNGSDEVKMESVTLRSEVTQAGSEPGKGTSITEHSETNQSHEQSPPPQEPRPLSSADSTDSEVKVEDVVLREKSSSPSSDGRPKPHPLSIDTSDSEASLSHYSPKLYTSGDEEGESYPLPSTPGLSPSPLSLSDEHAPMSVLFDGVTYLGCSSVDAPVSEVEANKKMYTLKTQAASSEPMHVILSIPVSNDGNVILKDPESEQPLSVFPVKTILFCARGNAEQLLDCFCLNIKQKKGGMYRCHAFRCAIPQACNKIFEAIGKAFKTKPIDRNLPPLTGDTLTFDFTVKLEIAEDDGKGNFTPAILDKDCFKLRQNVNKKVTLSVTQGGDHRPIIVERCFGMLISSVQVVKGSEMNLLDNMTASIPDNRTFIVSGLWDCSSHHLAPLNQDTKVLGYKYVTVAADLVLESVTEPVRFKREVKVSIKSGIGVNLNRSIMMKINKKAYEVGSSEDFRLTLSKSEEESTVQSTVYTVGDISSLGTPDYISKEATQAPSPPTQAEKTDSPAVVKKRNDSFREKNKDDSDDDGDDLIVSGWGDVDDTREDLLKDWGLMLDEWDGRDKDKPKPNKLVKLCRKGIPRHLRCQVWQMLTGAAHDPQLRESYRLLITRESPAEKVINWDIKRTYVGHEYFQESSGREALYKICKAYSVYDEEVGYCQGFSFMAATLLLQKMPEEEAFSVMVKILFQYGHRELFKANFQYLHLMFFQLDRLMEENLSRLFEHFKENRIETHMFASQWFLTLYTAKFPLSLVFRILDIYLCEGIKVIFSVALGLLKTASSDLLSLDFEGILNYFRVSLPKKFQTEEDASNLFQQMRQFKVNEKKLLKYEREYKLFQEQQALLEDPVMRLEKENKQLRESVMRLESENDNLAQELVLSKVTLRQEMDRLEERIDTLSKESRAQKTSADLSQQMYREVKEELQQAKEEYQKVLVQLMDEKMQHDAAIAEYKQLFQQLDEGHQKEKGELNQELIEVKAQLGKTGTNTTQQSSEHQSSLTSEERLRKLELELAQTKLALVEAQCKNQELERSVQQLSSSQRSPLSFSINRKKK